MISVGIDMGAKNVKVVVLKDGQIVSRGITLSGIDQKASAQQVFNEALQKAGASLSDIKYVTATGTGRDLAPNANGNISMMGADALGGTHLFPTARTVIDVGAEEGRAVRCDEKGKMIDFVINERCAAGAGTFIEAMARALEVKVEEMGPLSLKAEKAVPMNAQCTIFAESEVVSLIHAKTLRADISRAIHDAIADRIASMTRRLGVQRDVVLVGGVAKNVGFIDALKRTLGVDILVPSDPEFVGALGAALVPIRGIGGT